ncbi:MAG: C4-dicarboxylate ABC transporter permease [Burkholderiales bacterium RIFCSPLOWO2_02_FULL_57_36]|nr:MAG: C4-dicarboxylate ABC transporter permease [Burkholderiales bacterium RIFCSPLOWO2_02_FULL_57_36]
MKFLDHLEEWLITVLLAAGTLIVFVAVVHRYASGFPIPGVQDALIKLNTSWAQELTIYMFVWMAKFGAAYGVRTGIHVGVDILLNKLNTPWRNKMIVFGLLAGATFTGIIGTLGSAFVYDLSKTSSVSEVLEIPIWIVYLAIPLGSFLMSFRFLQVAWQFIKTGELPHHDHGHVEGIDEAAGGKA